MVVCFAVARLSILLTVDDFPPIKGVRERIQTRWGRASWQGYLSECPWCISVWIGHLVVLIVWVFEPLPVPALWPWVTSMVTGLLNDLDRDD